MDALTWPQSRALVSPEEKAVASDEISSSGSIVSVTLRKLSKIVCIMG